MRGGQKFTLTALESLYGSASGTQLCIMGMLCQLEDDQFCIEDPQGSVKVRCGVRIVCVSTSHVCDCSHPIWSISRCPRRRPQIDLTHAQLVSGLFTENTIVIAEGIMDDRTFVVTTLVRSRLVLRVLAFHRNSFS